MNRTDICNLAEFEGSVIRRSQYQLNASYLSNKSLSHSLSGTTKSPPPVSPDNDKFECTPNATIVNNRWAQDPRV